MDKPLDKRKYTKKPPAIAYSLSLPFGATLHVKKSANAWWMDQQKVHALTEAFRFRLTIPESCLHAGITIKNYEYFVELHPEFRLAKEGYGLDPDIRAKVTIVKSVNNGDIKAARWWAVHKMRDEFGPPSRRKELDQAIEARMNEDSMDPGMKAGYMKLLNDFNEGMKKLTIELRLRKSAGKAELHPVVPEIKQKVVPIQPWDPEEDDSWFEDQVNKTLS